MLEIIVPATNDLWDPTIEKFITTKETKLSLEHSLVSLSKWESKWHIPFLASKQLAPEQVRDYVRCMTITQHVDPFVYYALTQENLDDIMKYIEDPMSATVINEKALQASRKGPRRDQIVTSELIYYWMTALNIPFDPCQKWHLNRLMMLIKVASVEQQPPKKMSKADAMSQQRALNAARKAKLGTRG